MNPTRQRCEASPLARPQALSGDEDRTKTSGPRSAPRYPLSLPTEFWMSRSRSRETSATADSYAYFSKHVVVESRFVCDDGTIKCRMDIHVRRMAIRHGRSEGYGTLTAARQCDVVGENLGHECPNYRNRNFGLSCTNSAVVVFSHSGFGHNTLNFRGRRPRLHLDVVTDAGGLVVGVATLEDVFEYHLGKPIVGEHDAHPQMQHLAKVRASFLALPAVDGDSYCPQQKSFP